MRLPHPVPAVVLPRHQHELSRRLVHKGALKILYTLKNAGFEACLVGGCVRDILLDRTPKDFDIATDAEPQQIANLFRHCYMVGKRFRIVHVRMGRETFEVSTFRAHHEPNQEHKEVVSSDDGMILLDNAYGSIEQDVWRRDFTVNALYYRISDFSLIDYTGGLTDLKSKTLRMIGQPALRYQEDPVRMLRAIRFAAKLNFTLDVASSAPLVELKSLLLQVPPARLYLEVDKILLSGSAREAFELLVRYDLFALLFPGSSAALDKTKQPWVLGFYQRVLTDTDERLREGKYVTTAFLLAALLWPPLQMMIEQLSKRNRHKRLRYFEEAADAVLEKQLQRLAIPRRLLVRVREIWLLQLQLERTRGKRALRLLQHPKFRTGFDLLLLRAEDNKHLQVLATWWTQFKDAEPKMRETLLDKSRRSP